jgi:hypothetical protein
MLWLLLASYLLFFAFGGCADKLILFPNTDPEDPAGARRETIAFQNGQLEILIARSPGARTREPAAYVLTFTGNAGRAEWSASADAAEWGDKPVEVWAVNHPGFANSTGPAKLSRLAPAALAAYDALAKRAAGRPIFLSGTSLGATMALHVATQRPTAGMILRTPPPLRQLIMGRFGWWNLWLLATPVSLGVPSELDSLANARKSNSPALFIFIDTDDVVPFVYQQKVADAYAGQKHTITSSGGDHNALLTPKAAQQLRQELDWLWEKGMPATK